MSQSFIIHQLFSFKKGNRRSVNLRRIMAVFTLGPVFMLLLIVNNIFLFLDNVFFPSYKKQGVKSPVFIVSMPRTATTYLFHSMAANPKQYSAVRLWELLFAPSIIQKYFFRIVFKIDSFGGSPLRQTVLMIENFVISGFKKRHFMGLNLPEEDELFHLWNGSSLYFSFFYPDCSHTDVYFRFDKVMDDRKRKKILGYYKRCVQRHEFVFNRNGEKTFLSKNPAFIPKLKTLKLFFPDMRVISIYRNSGDTIASTSGLNEYIVGNFTSIKSNEKYKNKSLELLIEWFQYLFETLKSFEENFTLVLDFDELIQSYPQIAQQISLFTGNLFEWPEKAVSGKRKNDYKSNNNRFHLSEDDYERIRSELKAVVI